MRQDSRRYRRSEIDDPLTHVAGLRGNWADLVDLVVERWFLNYYIRNRSPIDCVQTLGMVARLIVLGVLGAKTVEMGAAIVWIEQARLVCLRIPGVQRRNRAVRRNKAVRRSRFRCLVMVALLKALLKELGVFKKRRAQGRCYDALS
jgi:hypothetical protein